MFKLVIKILLAYLIGAMLGACAALLAMEYNWDILITITVAMVVTLLVDFFLLRADL